MTADVDTVTRRGRIRPWSLSRKLRRPPLLYHLLGFAFIVLVPALLFSAFLIVQFSRQQDHIAAAQVSDTADIISNAVDREIFGMMTLGEVLASSPLIESSDLRLFHERTVAALRRASAYVTMVDPSLRVVVDSREAFPPERQQATETETIELVFRTGKPQVSDAYRHDGSADSAFYVAIPVFQGERVIYVIVINKRTEALGAAIAARDLPAAWSARVEDRRGNPVLAALAANGKMRQRSGLTWDDSSDIQLLSKEMAIDAVEASTTSSVSGWTTVVAVPSRVVDGPVIRSWLMLVAVGAALLVFIVILAVFFGQKIATPIAKLARQAEAIGRGEPASPVGTDIEEIGEVSKILAQASRDRRDAEEQTSFLMREMTHRAKNQYALIAAIARRAARESADTNEFLATLSEALSSLARSADLLAGRGWESASLRELVLTQLQAFGAGGTDQITLSGPSIKLNPAAAQTLGLALHELATNAAKYGALSVEEGSVRVEWSSERDRFDIAWIESNGPIVVEPKRAGFGTLVTQKMTARGLGGTVDLSYAPSGVIWRFSGPRESIFAY